MQTSRQDWEALQNNFSEASHPLFLIFISPQGTSVGLIRHVRVFFCKFCEIVCLFNCCHCTSLLDYYQSLRVVRFILGLTPECLSSSHLESPCVGEASSSLSVIYSLISDVFSLDSLNKVSCTDGILSSPARLRYTYSERLASRLFLRFFFLKNFLFSNYFKK